MSEYAEAPDYIPLSHLNAYAYCSRRFYYEFVLGEMVVNQRRGLGVNANSQMTYFAKFKRTHPNSSP